MFNFFRRSKKDTDARDKKSKDDAKNSSPSPKLIHNNKKDTMCKNNSIEKLIESAPQRNVNETSPKILTEFELGENNEKSAIVNGLLLTTDDITNRNDTTSSSTEETDDDKKTRKMDTKYLTMKRNETPPTSEPRNNTRNVKPCGHGTVAIQPRIPILTSRRDSSGTPPDSPKSFKKQKNDTSDDGSTSDNGSNKSDTISASMKIKLNLPNSFNTTTVLALTDSITGNDTKINDDVKYA